MRSRGNASAVLVRGRPSDATTARGAPTASQGGSVVPSGVARASALTDTLQARACSCQPAPRRPPSSAVPVAAGFTPYLAQPGFVSPAPPVSLPAGPRRADDGSAQGRAQQGRQDLS